MQTRWSIYVKIRDGSQKEIGDGYWLCKAIAADIEHKKVIPLYLEAYSQEAEDFKSENHQLFKVIDTIGKYLDNKGIYTIDRGGDRDKGEYLANSRNLLNPLEMR